MATTTPNNGWSVPTSTDYVKDGATAIETLGDAIDASVGTGLLAWTSWAPVLSSGWLNGNGVWTARYAQIGKIVHVAASFVVGTTTTKGTAMAISLPVTAHANSQINFTSNNTVAGSTLNILMGINATTTTIQMRVLNASATYLTHGQVTATVPATWATGDVVNMSFTYQAA
jgi:hypothetical protein